MWHYCMLQTTMMHYTQLASTQHCSADLQSQDLILESENIFVNYTNDWLYSSPTCLHSKGQCLTSAAHKLEAGSKTTLIEPDRGEKCTKQRVSRAILSPDFKKHNNPENISIYSPYWIYFNGILNASFEIHVLYIQIKSPVQIFLLSLFPFCIS